MNWVFCTALESVHFVTFPNELFTGASVDAAVVGGYVKVPLVVVNAEYVVVPFVLASIGVVV